MWWIISLSNSHVLFFYLFLETRSILSHYVFKSPIHEHYLVYNVQWSNRLQREYYDQYILFMYLFILKVCFHFIYLFFKSMPFWLLLVLAISGKIDIFLLVQLGCRLLHILKRLLPIAVYLLQLWTPLLCRLVASNSCEHITCSSSMQLIFSISILDSAERWWVFKWPWGVSEACCFCFQWLCRIYRKGMSWKVNHFAAYIFYFFSKWIPYWGCVLLFLFGW